MSTTNRFLVWGNLNNLALQVSIVALLAIGSTAVIFIGGIDLSPGSMIALLTMILASCLKFWGIGFWPAMLDNPAGWHRRAQWVHNGLRENTRLHHHLGRAQRLSRGRLHVQQRLSSLRCVHAARSAVLRSRVRHPLPLIYIVVFFAAAHWLMRYMRLGRAIYAVGGNANAARLSAST